MVLTVSAVRIAGLLEQLLRLGRVIGEERRVLVRAEIAGGHDRDRLARRAGALEGDDRLAIDAIGDGLAHANVVERLFGDVEEQRRQFARLHGEHLDARHLLGAIDPGLILLAVDHVELARLEGEIAARIRRDVAVHDLVEHRRAAEILLVGDEAHELLRLIFGEHERAGADRLLGEAVAHLLGGLLANHIAAVDIGDIAEEAGDRILQRDLQRVVDRQRRR